MPNEKVTDGLQPAMEAAAPEGAVASPPETAAPEAAALVAKIQALEANYQNLQTEYGRRGSEVGELRQTVANLQSEIPKLVEQAKATHPATDYEAMLANINTKFESGEITVSQALAETARITAAVSGQKAEQTAQAVISKALSERDNADVKKAFLGKYTDFPSIVESGALEPIKAENPLMNNVSAYFAYKATQEYERGKAEMAALKEGTKVAATVMGKPGADLSKQNKPKPTTDAEISQSMLAALAAQRAKDESG